MVEEVLKIPSDFLDGSEAALPPALPTPTSPGGAQSALLLEKLRDNRPSKATRPAATAEKDRGQPLDDAELVKHRKMGQIFRRAGVHAGECRISEPLEEESHASVSKTPANPDFHGLAALVLPLALGCAAALTADPVRVRGSVVSLDGAKLVVRSKDGKDVPITLKGNYAALAAVKSIDCGYQAGARSSERRPA